ncbi:hypothetical protein HMPREF0298_0187 [Corynebacterium lipophiloflavum DSM 44291]|uniref:Uncharacterized protein n=1 Tax=Corynebacterium lipophiloflavum (strain ATCC 700352 / DSM 44291 / CCUG 37336 / JCM 10383 / DMMZ 1944) TaxID=525263 RepID=C0XP17_CORLD|nr:hypothetical protein HMPREF0298_0187 [Corynebacterium lipophiloflavum DSM 44291]
MESQPCEEIDGHRDLARHPDEPTFLEIPEGIIQRERAQVDQGFG